LTLDFKRVIIVEAVTLRRERIRPVLEPPNAIFDLQLLQYQDFARNLLQPRDQTGFRR
jgi:hypothetical protein